ncbi:EmrB/QacA subfamily drug resistance transporter [Streptacidiphilus sp. BW17]|uniref:DHA2 family efflux MFS transporter permease subunit n=1 Tax=Streptacidiphilus sp. BW17 TaxID=3156274 RepID=UPI003515EDD8
MTDTVGAPSQGVGRGVVVWAVIVTGLAGFMAMLDNLVVITALPTIGRHLGGGIDKLEWTVNAYTLTFAVLQMLGASAGDRFGRRKMFMGGLVLFTVASAAAASTTGINALIAARAIQGVGAAIVMPLTLTLLTAHVPAKFRGVALGAWGAVNGLAVATGPLIGGAIVEHMSWQWIFWANVPIGILLVPLAGWRLKESRGPSARLDVVGTVLISLGLFGAVYGIIRGHDDGWTSTGILASLIGGAVLVLAFVLWELRVKHPMLPMRLFANRSFAGVNAASLLMALGMFGAIFLLTQFLQNVQGYDALGAGVRMLPWTGMPILVAPVAGMLSDKIGGRPIVILGLFFQAAGLAWYAVISKAGVTYGEQIPALILGGVGMALFYAPIANVLMDSVRTEEQGIASGANNALREFGGALGVAVLTSVFTAEGSTATAKTFVAGLVPALWVGAAVVALGGIAMCFVRGRVKQSAPAGGEAPVARAAEPDAVAGVS